MARWRWWCAVVVISSAWLIPGASAAKQEASSAEGTITSVDLNRSDPTLTLQLSTGKSLTLLLGRIGAWNNLTVDSRVRLRYTNQKGVFTIESIEITNPVQTATGDTATATSAPAPAVSPASKEKKTENTSASSSTTAEATSQTSRDEPAEKKKKTP